MKRKHDEFHLNEDSSKIKQYVVPRTMFNHKTRRLLKSNINVGYYSNKVLSQKLTQKLHITIAGPLTHCF